VSRAALESPVVLGLPRGGVVVGAGVAAALGSPLDMVVVRKLGAPGNPELGIGAVAEGAVTVLNEGLIRRLGVSPVQLDSVTEREHSELARRCRAYRGDDEPEPLNGRTAVVVDDGLATGYTARAAVEAVRRRGAEAVVLAVPVAAPDTARELERMVDELVCLELPAMMMGVGASYRDFRQTTDEEVMALLRERRDPVIGVEVGIPAGDLSLAGTLVVPGNPRGLVVFAHGSGSSRLSPRNQWVAERLNQAGLATLLFDLLTAEEAADRSLVFDIGLLGRRLGLAATWASRSEPTARLPMGFFGASTGAAAALVAAADRDDIAAVVSRGGRPDLAGPQLGAVMAPTRLIVGGNDGVVVDLNREAQRQLRCPNDLEIVPGAGHLFEEPGTLRRVAELAAEWFVRWIRA
jgi:putative phosphoribosyl transferase